MNVCSSVSAAKVVVTEQKSHRKIGEGAGKGRDGRHVEKRGACPPRPAAQHQVNQQSEPTP